MDYMLIHPNGVRSSYYQFADYIIRELCCNHREVPTSDIRHHEIIFQKSQSEEEKHQLLLYITTAIPGCQWTVDDLSIYLQANVINQRLCKKYAWHMLDPYVVSKMAYNRTIQRIGGMLGSIIRWTRHDVPTTIYETFPILFECDLISIFTPRTSHRIITETCVQTESIASFLKALYYQKCFTYEELKTLLACTLESYSRMARLAR